ncbi:uncharacterized protein LOC143530736 [Bidens hawaiensis]|uniref:uncharacterized protein LOC143530736 n=1 Tax=Bidens hawaiensis TaxID=980011 RepID=UPI00404977FA
MDEASFNALEKQDLKELFYIQKADWEKSLREGDNPRSFVDGKFVPAGLSNSPGLAKMIKTLKEQAGQDMVELANFSPEMVEAIYINTFNLRPGKPKNFEQLDEEDKERLKPIHAPVSGFGGEVMHPRGVISFPVTLSDGIYSIIEEVEFLVLPATSKHDIILGREAIGDFNAHPSTAHCAVWFSTRTGVAIIHVNRYCFAIESSKPSKIPKQSQRTEPEKWVLNKKFPDQTVIIGPAISKIVRTFLKQLLTKNMDIFVWQPADMTGVPRSIAEHKLRVRGVLRKKQKKGPEQTKAINDQVQDLLHAGIIRPIQYHTWVANPVIVPKSNGKRRMCIDFKDLNKLCPKYYYPLPEIDLKVDVVALFKFKCFLDAYKGYHQIHMAAGDEDKTAFRTDQGTFCYKMMPFGLKNAGDTYQRLMDIAFKDQIGRNLEVYMDDLVIKSVEEDQMLRDIEETFETLRGKFLRVIVTGAGFKANPDKVQAVARMPSPSSLKVVQTLNG